MSFINHLKTFFLSSLICALIYLSICWIALKWINLFNGESIDVGFFRCFLLISFLICYFWLWGWAIKESKKD